MTNIYIRTRGHKIDYNVGFLLTEKPPKKPDSKYSGNIEYPTCILERTGENGVYLFLSGIPSKRKDFAKTTIYYDLVLIVNCDPLEGEWDKEDKFLIKNEILTWLIWIWLEDVRKALREEIQDDERKKRYIVNLPIAGESELGKLLDEIFPEDEIEKLLLLTRDRNWEQDHQKNLDQTLKDCISQIPKPETMPDLSTLLEHDLKTWWGGVKNDDTCKQWIKLVEKLLNGEIEKGKALLLNGGADSSLRSLFVENEYLGVLLDRQWSQFSPKIIEPLPKDLSKKSLNINKVVEFGSNLTRVIVNEGFGKPVEDLILGRDRNAKKKPQ